MVVAIASRAVSLVLIPLRCSAIFHTQAVALDKVSGDLMVIGNGGDDSADNGAGAVHVYLRNPDSGRFEYLVQLVHPVWHYESR